MLTALSWSMTVESLSPILDLLVERGIIARDVTGDGAVWGYVLAEVPR